MYLQYTEDIRFSYSDSRSNLYWFYNFLVNKHCFEIDSRDKRMKIILFYKNEGTYAMGNLTILKSENSPFASEILVHII